MYYCSTRPDDFRFIKQVQTFFVLLGLLLPAINNAQTFGDAIDKIAIQHDLMGGSVVVFCDTSILQAYHFGKASLDNNRLVNENTMFRMASISKIATAVACLQLMEQNLLQLDADIGTLLGYPVRNPYFPLKAITPRMLLSHTSSLSDGPSYTSFLTATYQETPIPDIREILLTNGRFFHLNQFYNALPGSYFQYSNLNYVLLGTIIEKLTGERFDQYCNRRIFQPMKSLASFNVHQLAHPENLAVIYRKTGSEWRPQMDQLDKILPEDPQLKTYMPGTNGGRFGPQGGLRISANDLAKLLQLLFVTGSDHLLDASSVQQLISNQWTYNGENGNNQAGLFLSWGLGIHRITSTPDKDCVLQGSQSMIGHAGEAYGLISDAFYDPDRKIGFVFVTNGSGTGYQIGKNSAFYTVEQAIFQAVEAYGKPIPSAPKK